MIKNLLWVLQLALFVGKVAGWLTISWWVIFVPFYVIAAPTVAIGCVWLVCALVLGSAGLLEDEKSDGSKKAGGNEHV